LENDFSALKEKFNLAEESMKEQFIPLKKTNNYAKNEDNNLNLEKKNLKSKIDDNIFQSILKMLKRQKEINKNDDSIKNDQLSNENSLKKKLSEILNTQINNDDKEDSSNLFSKYLKENSQKIIADDTSKTELKNDEENEKNGKISLLKNRKEDIEKKMKNYDNLDLLKMREELLKITNSDKNTQKNSESNLLDKLEINNGANKKQKLNNLDSNSKSEINFDSLKGYLNNAKNNDKNKIDEPIIEVKNNYKKDSLNENKDSVNKKNKLEKSPNDFNFSLGEIESQIEMLKNLSIKP